ncbi:hypothetical protein NA56DRAFT_753594 [Hyaloscypha hepaticicola]|uniref:Heterokaryon incompatibility domain-containing protein n=1 Tax=Hyaloscypha hepaticicola TaxID=2082293 RepID=A0A2J6PPP6_9HELO|nr:hypothetical protein NA56DRAFT_753594 [Hyaloscypha hepaticicola]
MWSQSRTTRKQVSNVSPKITARNGGKKIRANLWVTIILFGLAMMLWSPSNALERAKDTANSLAIVTIVPFVFTWIHCSLLFSRKAKDDKYEDEDFLWNQTARIGWRDQLLPQAGRKTHTSTSPSMVWMNSDFSPGSFDDALHGEVITAKFSGTDRPAYEALSYTWADEAGDEERSYEKRWMWIDAICIDQSSETERSSQVRMMSKIYMAARRVVVYTGEGTTNSNILFDWWNGLKTEDLNILLRWDLDDLAVDTVISFERYWSIVKEPSPELVELAKELFSRRWFQRVWVLQEVSLPDVRNTIVICGTKNVTAIRALHALSLIYNESAGTMIRIFVLLKKQIKVNKSHLLDILIETRYREAGDPRDKIFVVLSIANYLDKERFPELRARYSMTTPVVYEYYSAFFIRHHGPAFFLSLIKSPPNIPTLPSWVADWTGPWPNYKAVEGRDFAAALKRSGDKDNEARFTTENGHRVLTLQRPEILQGYFTRNGHIDDEMDKRVEGLDRLRKGEILIEMYPGLAALLRKKEGFYHVFIQVCSHALSEDGVKELVSRWSAVVVDGEGPKASGSVKYLGPVKPFRIQ